MVTRASFKLRAKCTQPSSGADLGECDGIVRQSIVSLFADRHRANEPKRLQTTSADPDKTIDIGKYRAACMYVFVALVLSAAVALLANRIGRHLATRDITQRDDQRCRRCAR